MIDFVFKEGSFENRSRGKVRRNHIDEDFVQDLDNMMRANFVQKRICEDSRYKQFRAKIVQNQVFGNFLKIMRNLCRFMLFLI